MKKLEKALLYGFKIPKCKFCESDTQHYRGLNFSKTCSSGICKNLLRKEIANDPEFKIKVSNGMKKTHATGNHPGWDHINKDKNRKSFPERFLSEVLRNNGIYDRFCIAEKLPVGKYFLDFAIIELKLDIEVDGEQHFRTENAIRHDKKRDEFTKSLGWKVYRICWKNFVNNTKQEIDELINYINDVDNNTNRYYEIPIKQKRRTRAEVITDIKKETDKKYEPIIEKIKNSDIDFSKFGWVQKVSEISGLAPQKINRLMKRYLPEILEMAFSRQDVNSKRYKR